MTLEISSNRRTVIKEKVLEVLKNYSEPVLPVKIGSIIRSMSYVKLISYSSQIKKYGITYNELITISETKDAYVVKDNETGRFCIYYNNIDPSITLSNRVRWNLAHELGHIVLDHHRFYKTNKLYRTILTDSEYAYLEKEADYFAQLILVPHAALIAFNINSYNHIRTLCKISGPAAQRRHKDFIRWKQNIDANDKYDNKIFYYYFNFLFKKECKTCGASLIQRHGKYCPICGFKNTLEWGDGDKMKYPLLETYENGKLKECPNCTNEDTDIEGDYCQICGTSLVNKCTNENCTNVSKALPSNAHYCPVCGSESSFYRDNLLKMWNYNNANSPNIPMNIFDSIDEELPFY